MKRFFNFLTLSIFLGTSLFAIEVNRPELDSTKNEVIEFINYIGPHKVIDSAAAITNIGTGLGQNVNLSVSSEHGNKNKYYVVHAVDTTESKLNADILYIGKDATVDHIDNLRRIIQGYLISAYGYDKKDAHTLAVFITVYNAVYRGKYDVYSSKYNKVVLDNLTSQNCGLSVNYKDWPGKSEIVIPLFDVKNGGISTVDTSVISDSKVVDSMQEDEDKNIDSRKDMVDLKEREAEEANEKAQEAQKQATEEQKELEEAKQEAEEAQKKAEENPDDQKAQEEAQEAQEKLEEQQEKAEQAKEEAKEAQELADKKQTEAQNERKEIAKDQQEILNKQRELANMNTEYGLLIVNEKDLLSRLVKFNIQNGDIVKKSPVTVVRNRTVFDGGKNNTFICIAGDNQGNGTIKLVLLDQENMEIVRESNETIASDSVLVQDGQDYYCVIDDNGKFVVAKYNTDLSLRCKSKVAVKSSTPITVTPSGIVVTDTKGQLILLSQSNLSAITQSNSNSANAK